MNPTVGIIDSTFIESAYGGPGSAPNGYKRASGCALHVIIDKTSRVLTACVLPGTQQDAEGARRMLPRLKRAFPTVRCILGDKAYAQRPLQACAAQFGITMDGRSPPLRRGTIFNPMPLRWRVERFFSWVCKWRRIAKNWCHSIWGYAHDVAWALFGLMLKRSV